MHSAAGSRDLESTPVVEESARASWRSMDAPLWWCGGRFFWGDGVVVGVLLCGGRRRRRGGAACDDHSRCRLRGIRMMMLKEATTAVNDFVLRSILRSVLFFVGSPPAFFIAYFAPTSDEEE